MLRHPRRQKSQGSFNSLRSPRGRGHYESSPYLGPPFGGLKNKKGSTWCCPFLNPKRLRAYLLSSAASSLAASSLAWA